MIGVVILNYDTWEESMECMESILAGSSSGHIRIYLVDNASPVRQPASVAGYCLEHSVTYIQNSENTGYAAGNNVGIRQAMADGCSAVLISNSDVRYGADSIGLMYRYLTGHPGTGIVGPKVLFPDGKVLEGCLMMRTGVREKYLLRTCLRFLFPKYDRRYWGRQHDYENETFPAYAVSGCCFMISRECLERVTPLDEGTFLYDEELILGIRMEEAGYGTVYYPESAVLHKTGQSTGGIRTNPSAYTYQIRSEIYYCKKYLHMKNWQILPLYLYRAAVYAGYCLGNRRFREMAGAFLADTRKEFRK